MRKTIALLSAVGLCLAAAPASVAGEPSASSTDSRRICRDSGRQLGSHIRTARRCRTAEQWRQEDEERAQSAASLRMTEGQNDGQAPRQPQ